MNASHEQWEELAAAFALDALEPDETLLFTTHLSTCEHCRKVLAGHALVAAQIGSLVHPFKAPPWDRVRPAVVARSRRTAARWLAAAAAVVLLGAGALAWQATRPSHVANPQRVALSSCAAQARCRVVHLQGRADLVVTDDAVRLLPTRLGTPPAGRVYVLWQLPRAGRPARVATLTSTVDGTVGPAYALVLRYDDTAAFGLSLEPAGVVPTHPTTIVAVGPA